MEKSQIAVATVMEYEGKILLVKEAKGNAQVKWNQPAGRLESGESVKEGALRETKEETGYDVVVTGLIGIYDELSSSKYSRIRFVFSAKLSSQNQGSYSNDISEVKWFDKTSIKELSKESLASEVTYKSIHDYLLGKSYPLNLLQI